MSTAPGTETEPDTNSLEEEGGKEQIFLDHHNHLIQLITKPKISPNKTKRRTPGHARGQNTTADNIYQYSFGGGSLV
jgi:hypothetical protein